MERQDAETAAFTVQGGCIHGSPSICMGNAFFVLGAKWAEIGFRSTKNGSDLHLKCSRMCDSGVKGHQVNWRATSLNMPAWTDPPDGDLGGFGQSDGALEARVDLAHLHGSFQADHLEPTVAEI